MSNFKTNDQSNDSLNLTKLSGFLMNLKYLRNLDLSANGIKDDGIESIIPALIQMGNLENLDLSRCMVSNVGLIKYLF